MKTKRRSAAPAFSLFFSLCWFLFQPAGILHAQNTFEVPADFATIQSAVDAAQEGDTVLVSPGIYYENVQLRGRNITLSSRYFLDADPAAVVRQTVIDGSQPAHPDTASCLLVWKGETAATVIQGFTFRGGKGTVWLDPAGAGTFREGGGILTEYSAPVIRHNIIRDNVVTPGGSGIVSVGGGGIRCGDGAVRIENNYIVHNRAEGYGGGIVLNYCSGAVVQNNIIASNYGGKDFSGGGFWATGANTNTVNVLRNNTIAYNTSPPAAGQYGGKGGGVWMFSIKLQLKNNIVWGNTQASGKPISTADGVFELQYNCIETGFPGTATISADPLFRDTSTFVPEAGSPAVDAGNPGASFYDFSRNGLRAAFPSRGKLRCDLGAYGGANTANPASPASFLSASNFTKVLNSPVVTTPGDSRSVNWIDIDGDDDLDLFISNGPEAGQNNMLYRNNGNGGFVAVTGDPIVQDNKPSDGATWADYDNDGDNDCFVVNWYGINNMLYKNNAGIFEQITTGNLVADGGYSETASWGDYDKDGYLDLYVTNSDGNKRNFLYHNSGDGTFTKVGSGSPVTDIFISRNVNWTDYDNDGDLDLFVTNEGNQQENLYRNHNGNFTKIATGPLVNDGGKTMSSSWGDTDNDGDLDVVLINDQGNESFFRNDENDVFTKLASAPLTTSGGNSFSSQWADIDNDGDLDLFVTNAFWGGMWKNFLFINQGNNSFVRNLTEAPAIDQGWSYGCAFGDFDRDGDLDLGVANCFNATQEDYLYENHAAETANKWLVVRCTGTTSNRSAIGAKVRVKAVFNGNPVWQMREISAQSGYCGQNQLDAHFGLADAGIVDSLIVEWPSGGKEYYTQLYPDQHVELVEGQGITGTSEPGSAGFAPRILSAVPNPFSDSMTVSWEQPVPGQVSIEISDQSGAVIRTSRFAVTAGPQQWLWDGADGQGGKVPNGAYVVVVKGEHGQTAAQVIRLGE